MQGGVFVGMVVIHVNWWGGAVRVWGERAPGAGVAGIAGASATAEAHPFALSEGELRAAIGDAGGEDSEALRVWLPSSDAGPLPSPRLAHATGHIAHLTNGARAGLTLSAWRVPAIVVPAGRVAEFMERLEELPAGESSAAGGVVRGDSARFFAVASRFALSLLADQRFVPSVEGDVLALGSSRGAWRPWLGEEAAEQRVGALLSAMPAAARCAGDDPAGQQPTVVMDEFLTAVVDAECRAALQRESMGEAIEAWSEPPRRDDPHVVWLSGLLTEVDELGGDAARRTLVAKQSRRWITGLEERGRSGSWRLCLKLSEPGPSIKLADLAAPGDDVEWSLTFHLQSIESPKVILDAEDIWSLRAESATVGGRRVEQPKELLLGELGRATRLYPRLESALEDSEPVGMSLNTKQAYEFLREIRSIMQEQGFGVLAPEWWDTPSARLGARLQIFSGEEASAGEEGRGGAAGSVAPAKLGLAALVSYQWKIAIGDTPLTIEEFEKLAAQRSPLVRIGGRWVEVRAEDIKSAVEFIRANPGGSMRVGDALRMAYAADRDRTGVSILGMDAEGWLATVLGGPEGSSGKMPMLGAPAGFRGELRPYQVKGLSWLSFLDRMGLGPCLADDMGLGKTIQLLAMLLHERERAGERASEIGPTLLVVPMSIVGNWTREAQRFAPSLRVLVHHGPERLSGESLLHRAMQSDLVVTTYALAHRDRESIEKIAWWRIVLDEAQNIKNASAKQSKALRELEAPRRTVLTGTPLENRLSELWSIMDFCNPGLLGGPSEFRRSFALPIERYHDKEKSRQLRSLVKPFLLRRLKTDPSVISDLPEKVETKEYCRLSAEQVSLYEECVKMMLGEVERAEGIRRRGIVLTTLIRLKQICNHPAQLAEGALARLSGAAAGGASAPVEPEVESESELEVPADAARSGKCIRIIEMLDEVLASGEKALVFTQFRRMGSMLAGMLRKSFDREVLFLHGGVPQRQREQMIEQFQNGGDRSPIFILSLKAGGVGLNLTAASHVFHFDRWWNPAVENQATDRAFRIGQTRAVSVHKFIVTGTLEERIDQMIESKIALAEDVIGSGEEWLTELSADQLRDILTLRPDALADED